MVLLMLRACVRSCLVRRASSAAPWFRAVVLPHRRLRHVSLSPPLPRRPDQSTPVLADKKLRNCSQQFVVDVISDEAIHKVAGDAITDTILVTVQQASWNSMVKSAGVSIMALSVGLISVILSPY